MMIVISLLLFVEDNDEYISNLKNAIFLFEAASGLSINLIKSTISPINEMWILAELKLWQNFRGFKTSSYP